MRRERIILVAKFRCIQWRTWCVLVALCYVTSETRTPVRTHIEGVWRNPIDHRHSVAVIGSVVGIQIHICNARAFTPGQHRNRRDASNYAVASIIHRHDIFLLSRCVPLPLPQKHRPMVVRKLFTSRFGIPPLFGWTAGRPRRGSAQNACHVRQEF